MKGMRVVSPHPDGRRIAFGGSEGWHSPGETWVLENFPAAKENLHQAVEAMALADQDDLNLSVGTVSRPGNDEELQELRKFCKLAAGCNPNIIEYLYVTQGVLLEARPWVQLRNNRHLFLSKRARFTFSGYAVAQLKRIQTHRGYLLNPPDHKPTRAEFGLPEVKIAGILGKINVKLIKENFGEYLKRVPGAASDYYNYSWYWTALHDKRLFSQIKPLARFFRMFFALHSAVFGNLFLLLIVILVVPSAFLITIRKQKGGFHLLCLLEGVVHYNFLVSVLLTNNGVNNLRFRVPVEPLILLIFYGALFTWGRRLFSKVPKRRESTR
jgi:hypothetical protein